MWRGFLQICLGLRYISRLDSSACSKPLGCEMLVESKELFHAANFKEERFAAVTSSLSEEERSQVLNVFFFFMTEDDNDHDNFDLHNNDDEEANHHNDGGVPSSFINDHDNSGEGGDGNWRSELPHLWVSDPITFSSA